MKDIKTAIKCRKFLKDLGVSQEKSDAVMAVMAYPIHRNDSFSNFDCIPICGHSASKSELFLKIEEAMLKNGDLSCL